MRPVQAVVFLLTAESSSSLTPDPLRHIWGVSSLGLLGIMGIMQWEGVVGEEGLVYMEEPAVGGRECL